MTRLFKPILLVAAILITCIAPHAIAEPTSDDPFEAPGAEPRLGAETYYRASQSLLQQLRDQLSTISHSASIAAKLYVDEPNMGIGVDGDPAFCSELVGRAGGIMAIGEGLLGRLDQGWKGVILYCLVESASDQDKQTAGDVARIAAYQKAGCHVIVFGTRDLIDRASLNLATVDVIAVWHWPIRMTRPVTVPYAPPAYFVPTYQLSQMATGWTWCAEFVGACSRLGKTPVMFQSVMVPKTGWERLRRYMLSNSPISSYQKFHEDSAPTQPASATQPIIDPISYSISRADPTPEGQLGAQWIERTSEGLAWIHEHEKSSIEQAGRRCARALAAGHHLFWATEGHGTSSVVNVAGSAGLFDADVKKMQKGDLLVFMGYDKIMNDDSSQHFADNVVRKNGASAIWICTTDYRKDQLQLKGDEMLIDTHWRLGDAVVTFPGYDIKILPTSGVLTTAVFMMIQSEMLGDQ